ncbi:MAG: hypothetical protein R3Y24_13075 [Eubacteriales bacterium]
MCKIEFKKEFGSETIGMELELHAIKWISRNNTIQENDTIGKIYYIDNKDMAVYLTADSKVDLEQIDTYTIELVTTPISNDNPEQIEAIKELIKESCKFIFYKIKDVVGKYEIGKNCMLEVYKNFDVQVDFEYDSSVGFSPQFSFGIKLSDLGNALNTYPSPWWIPQKDTCDQKKLAYNLLASYYNFVAEQGGKVRNPDELKLQATDKNYWKVIPRLPLKTILEKLLEKTDTDVSQLIQKFKADNSKDSKLGELKKIMDSPGIAHSNIEGVKIANVDGIVIEVRKDIQDLQKEYLWDYIPLTD